MYIDLRSYYMTLYYILVVQCIEEGAGNPPEPEQQIHLRGAEAHTTEHQKGGVVACGRAHTKLMPTFTGKAARAREIRLCLALL